MAQQVQLSDSASSSNSAMLWLALGCLELLDSEAGLQGCARPIESECSEGSLLGGVSPVQAIDGGMKGDLSL